MYFPYIVEFYFIPLRCVMVKMYVFSLYCTVFLYLRTIQYF